MFDRLARWSALAAGSPVAFVLAVALILVWLAFGPFIGFANTLYQLVINTATTIITFLMVFLIQASQNREGAAIQAKLDIIIEASAASNTLIGLENLSTAEIELIRETIYQRRMKT